MKEYAPVDGGDSKPEEIVCGVVPPETSVPVRKELAGRLELPVILTVPESVAVVMVGAVKLRGLAAANAPRFVVRLDEENTGKTDDIVWKICTLKVPLGSCTV